MRVFISCSGKRSQEVALILKDWCKDVIQAVDPFVSSEDIDKGAQWFSDISGELEQTDFGIVCLTPENLTEPWILFEAGALSKRVGQSKVCPFLLGLLHSDLEGPLSQFQGTRPGKDDVLKLARTMNDALKENSLKEEVLRRAFDRCWPELESRLTKVLKESPPTPGEKKTRASEDVLEEILRLCRNISQSVGGLGGVPLGAPASGAVSQEGISPWYATLGEAGAVTFYPQATCFKIPDKDLQETLKELRKYSAPPLTDPSRKEPPSGKLEED